MKKLLFLFLYLLPVTFFSAETYSQKSTTGYSTILSSDIESHISFLASPLLCGRLNGSREMNIAASYLASQAKKTGLKPAMGNSYYCPYSIVEKSIDHEKTKVYVLHAEGDTVTINEPLYQFLPMVAADFELEGEVIFTGYGIKSDQHEYDDFGTLDISGKIVLIMNRAPLTNDGKCQFEDQAWLGYNGLQMKLQGLIFRNPKAILVVSDPKSGLLSMEEALPEITEELRTSISLKGKKAQTFDFPWMPKVMFIHSRVADELLKGTGRTLTELQAAIDRDMKPQSFLMSGRTLKITEVSRTLEKQLPNIAGIVEGSDPLLKNEVIIFSAHMDHIGIKGEKIYTGADDDASGCAALLELAEAFQSLPRKPLRSVMFLWVSGEEVGLFGSESYVSNPLFPLENTVADINLDMIGRVKGVADTSSQNPMTGPGAVFVITGNQSSELVSIADEMARKNGIKLDYSLSGRNHPLMLFARSDHFNFVKNDIPVLFFYYRASYRLP